MNDYKGLIAKCDEWIAKADNLGADDLANHISRCADAIEQLVVECKTLKHNLATVVKDCDKLVKERDAAITDFTLYVKHIEDGRKAFSCEFCDENGCDNCKHCSNFEWRGVQEE